MTLPLGIDAVSTSGIYLPFLVVIHVVACPHTNPKRKKILKAQQEDVQRVKREHDFLEMHVLTTQTNTHTHTHTHTRVCMQERTQSNMAYPIILILIFAS